MIESNPSPKQRPLEMWGGPECSYVRVGERFADQFAWSRHDDRPDDLDRFAALGLRALRYPISWERMTSGRIDWAWAEARLERLRVLGVRPIVGFVHHGSGPLPEGMLSPDFPARLAEFAATVAQRFPWIDAYTPVNEPLTTARFSGLYGVWHPHGTDHATFVRCLMNEIEAIRRAMAEIRKVNASAQLVQTEDVGKTHSTPRLDYQADFENERRWLSFDLLCGRVDPSHPLYNHLREGGIAEGELATLCMEPCPPDLLGMNHYVTSERFLDDRLDHYPAELHGGNGRDAYVDVAALRVRQEEALGPAGLLREVWQRFKIPIAITEVQLACSREEQLRWFMDVWHSAEEVRAEGADIRAVTAWALLGAYDWDSLLTEERGHYESGVFDLRAPAPRPTVLATAIKSLATEGRFVHPVLAQPGWWRRPDRIVHPVFSAPRTGVGPAWRARLDASPPILILGARGTLGRAFLQACDARALPAIGITRDDADLTQPLGVADLLERHRPWAVINCAGYVRVDAAETEIDACARDNTIAAVTTAEACAARGIKFLTFSTDLVFDGQLGRPYVESDEPNPLNVYGRTKLDAERAIAKPGSSALVVRTSAFFGPADEANFAIHVVRELEAGRNVHAADCLVSPTYVPDLVANALDLLIDDAAGIWHLANTGAVTWVDWARAIARLTGHSEARVNAASPEDLRWVAMRPAVSALASERGQLLPSWEHALERFVAAMEPRQADIAA